VSGTVRFTGIVVGFAALGVVLFGRIASVITAALPSADPAERSAFVHDVASGDLSAPSHAFARAGDLHGLALHAFGAGYEALLFSSAGLTAIAAGATWLLVRASDTRPIAKPARHTTAVADGERERGQIRVQSR
jgi:hypothetical protein